MKFLNQNWKVLRRWLNEQAILREKDRIGYYLHRIEMSQYRITRLQGKESLPPLAIHQASGDRYSTINPAAFRHPVK